MTSRYIEVKSCSECEHRREEEVVTMTLGTVKTVTCKHPDHPPGEQVQRGDNGPFDGPTMPPVCPLPVLVMNTSEKGLTPEGVQRLVDRIENCAEDFERAHSMQDDLFRLVLHSIATGECEDPSECARVALTTSEIEFSRHCA